LFTPTCYEDGRLFIGGWAVAKTKGARVNSRAFRNLRFKSLTIRTLKTKVTRLAGSDGTNLLLQGSTGVSQSTPDKGQKPCVDDT